MKAALYGRVQMSVCLSFMKELTETNGWKVTMTASYVISLLLNHKLDELLR